MRPEDVRALLERVAAGEASISEALRTLEKLPFEELGFAKVDHHRALRTGLPEVVFGEGKTIEQVARIAEAIAARGQTVLVTRIDAARAEQARALLAPAVAAQARVEPVPRLLIVGEPHPVRGRGAIAVVSAGTADQPVAEEAARTAELFGNRVTRVYDVGVAGLHRLVSHREALESAEVVVVVAGMEGALPSVVAGLISRPVIGVPTSIGFGASFGGIAALLSMLNACAAGITVVNIDNGFGAGYAASLMNAPRKGSEARA
ncbi:MAG: nickel pincer cofactor biosynthesis protein LarB [Deltaproteobacteria bacterium]|nr:nickel pincer cofactor biosynthesis protein LarB [Deltaproteobacteria bacterium]